MAVILVVAQLKEHPRLRAAGGIARKAHRQRDLVRHGKIHAERLAADFRIRFGTPLHPIGRITSGPGLVWLRNGKPEPLDWHGFEHY